jgi:hypothetical protein
MRSVLLFFLGWSAIAAAANGPAKFFARRDYGPGADLVRVADVNGDGIPHLELRLRGDVRRRYNLGQGLGQIPVAQEDCDDEK